MVGAVRLTYTLATVSERFWRLRYLILQVLVVGLGLGLVLGLFLALTLERPLIKLTYAIRRLVSGDLPTVTAERIRLRQDIDLVTVTPEIRAERRLRAEQGALVVRISPAMAEQVGVAEGDVIVAINRAPVTAAEEVREFLDALQPGTAFRIYLERNGRYTYTDLVRR